MPRPAHGRDGEPAGLWWERFGTPVVPSALWLKGLSIAMSAVAASFAAVRCGITYLWTVVLVRYHLKSDICFLLQRQRAPSLSRGYRWGNCGTVSSRKQRRCLTVVGCLSREKWMAEPNWGMSHRYRNPSCALRNSHYCKFASMWTPANLEMPFREYREPKADRACLGPPKVGTW